uniref:Uncharacterized protein n=1 Tax=Castor canadensis TaxID=51338 RepID=A0A8C0W213_CASCN
MGSVPVSSALSQLPGALLRSGLKKKGCRNLLSLLDNNEIMALCDTVINRLVQPYSQSAELLKRFKKVHREVLFKYSATQTVILPPATEKHSIIQHAKDYWKKQSQLKLKGTPEPVTKTEDIQLFQQILFWDHLKMNGGHNTSGMMSSLGFFHNTSEQNVIDYHGSRNCEPSFAITGERGISFSQPQPGFPLVMVGVAGTVHRGNSCGHF